VGEERGDEHGSLFHIITMSSVDEYRNRVVGGGQDCQLLKESDERSGKEGVI
jgi:hypothetical protein